MKKILIGALAVLCAVAAAQAAMPLQLGIAGDALQFPAADTPVRGLKLNLPYAMSDDAAGIDLGFVGNVGEFTGLRLNAVNLSETNSTGLELGALNIARGEMHGMQFGIYNHADQLHGFQLGILNHAGRLSGLQVGLLNFVDKGHVKAFPFFICSW